MIDVKGLIARLRGEGGILRAFRRELIVLALIVAGTFLFHRLVYVSTLREMKALDEKKALISSELKIVESEIRATEGLREKVAEAERRYELTEKRLRSTMERLPSDKQVSRLLADISGEGFTRGVRITSIRPLQPVESGGVTRLRFQLAVESRYVPFGEYLARIEGLPRLVVVDNFMVEAREGAAPDLAGQVYLSAYVLDGKR